MSDTSAKIQMYRLNELGDCFLITLAVGDQSSRMLIDCGSFRNSKLSVDRIKEVVAQIKTDVDKKPLDVVVGTHQHNDHVSGFVHAEKEFKKIGVGQVWLSWLDNPTDKIAQQIGSDHHNLKMHLAAARDSLTAHLEKAKGARPMAARSLELLNDILGFYGAAASGMPPELPAKGIEILKEIGTAKPEYLLPGRTLEMPGLPPGSVKIHVLGPPRDHDLLYTKDPKKGESYDHALAIANMHAARFLGALRGGEEKESGEEEHYPFAQRYKLKGGKKSPALRKIMGHYRYTEDAWRTIDDDWLMQAESLALYLDTFTNNSSLVLAIELVQSRKVLLFAADAQTGNWLSWDDVEWDDPQVKTDDLLARTVFYKVGHHASHNATLVAGFEKMTNPDLVALIPVHKKDPNITKPNGWKMPAKNLFARLKEKTANRVLQMDGDNPTDCQPAKEPAKSSWARVGILPKITDLCVELVVPG